MAIVLHYCCSDWICAVAIVIVFVLALWWFYKYCSYGDCISTVQWWIYLYCNYGEFMCTIAMMVLFVCNYGAYISTVAKVFVTNANCIML